MPYIPTEEQKVLRAVRVNEGDFVTLLTPSPHGPIIEVSKYAKYFSPEEAKEIFNALETVESLSAIYVKQNGDQEHARRISLSSVSLYRIH